MFLISEGIGKSFDEAMDALAMDSGVPAVWSPPCDLFETASAFTLKAEVPGISLDGIVLEVVGDSITLAGERRGGEDTKTVSYHRMERTAGKFIRVFRLSQAVDEDKVLATLKDGLLTVIMPKKDSSAPKKVEING
jgi:HSP20 family protein